MPALENPDSTTGNSARAWTRPHLLDLQSLSADEIMAVLDTASSLKEVSTRSIKKIPALRGKVMVNLFFEDSTRTKTSFSLAAQRMSADIVDFSVSTSSVSKGETVRDTAKTIEAMGVDVIVIRHKSSGAPHLLAQSVSCSVINAGDGSHEHPTQGLLDVFTILEHLKSRRAENSGANKISRAPTALLADFHIAIVGDVANSRVARSNIHALTKLGAKVTLVGPSTLVPNDLRFLAPPDDSPSSAPGTVSISHDLDSVLPTVHAVNMLRVQFERLTSAAFPSVREYSHFFGLTPQRLAKARPDLLVLHPGPMNRGIEITTEVADGKNSAILQQVTNGLAVRMAVLYLCVGASIKSHSRQ